MTLPIRPDLTFGSTPALPGALTGRLPFGGPPPAPYTPEGWEEERKRRLREAIAMGLPIRDVREIDGELKPTQLPAVTIEAPRPALPQLANVLARETYPELEGTTPVPTSPLERYSVGGVLADVAAQPIAALMSTSGRIGEGVQRTLGFEEAARRTKERTQALNEALAPTTGLGVAARVPAELLAGGAPYMAAGRGVRGLLRSAGLTGIESQAEEGSTIKALADLTESETLRRIAESPYKTAADIGLDLALNIAPDVLGAFRSARPAAQAINVPESLRAAEGIAERTPTLPFKASIPQEVRAVGQMGFVKPPKSYALNNAIETEHVARVMSATEPALSRVGARAEETINGAGLFGGEISPNRILRFAGDATDDDIRTAAATRGIALGQDQQLWYRKARPTDTEATAAFVITGPDFAPLPDEVINEVVSRLRADDALGPYGGATRDGNHLLALNLKRYTEMDDVQFQQAVRRALDDVAQRYDIDAHPSDFYAEHLDGTQAYAEVIGRRPDALRAARSALVDAGPEYLRYAQTVGADVGATERELAARVEYLDRLIAQAGRPSGLTRQLAGKTFDIGGATGEALRQIVQRPALATGVGAAVGAAQSPEDRFGGAAVGALAGAGIAGAVVSGKQLLRARRALIEAGLPTELDRAYALAKGSIDFTGQVGRQIARRGREGFKRAFEKAIDGLAEIDSLSARAEARGMAPERSAATGLNMALSSQATAARALREGIGLEQGGIIDPETLEIVAPSLERVFQPLGNSPIKNEQGMTYAVALRRLGRYERAGADLADWETRAASGAGRVGQRPVSTATMPSGAKRATRLKDLIGSAGETIPTTSGLGDRPNPLQVYGGDEAMLEADRAIVEAFGQKPEFVEFANGLRQYTDGLANYAVKTGLWTPEMAQRFKDSDALYVPFKRLIEANTAKPKMGMRGRPMPGQVTPGVQRFKGSDLMIGNPAEALAEYTVSLIRRADAYRVGTMLIDTVEALGEEGAGILTKIDATDARVKAAAVANAEAAYRGMGLPEDEAEALADVFARLSTKNEVIWRNTPNGKEYFLVNDPALLNALSTLNVQDEGAVKAIVAIFGPLKRLATAFATGYAPQFWLGTNLPRDVQMGLLQTSGIRPNDVAGGVAEALKSIFGRSAEVEALSRAGAGQVSQYGGTLSPAAVARQIAPTTGGEQALGTLQQYIGAPLAAMERVGRASELPMRLAAARAARRRAAQAGATEAGQRALAARQFAQATVDFRRRSGYALDRMFEQTVPYYGAAKKGLGMFLRTAARNPKRVGAAVGLVGLAVAMEDVLLGEGQERAEALDRPSYERAKYLRVGNTKVALPQELAVFASAFRVGLAQLRQDDPYVYEQFKKSLENLLPPVIGDVKSGRYLPFPVLGQLEEIAQNRSVFTGRPIVPQGMERRMPSERRYETTAPTFDVLAGAARALGAEEASPLQAEYLVRGLTGRFTPAITAVTDIPAQAMLGEESRRQVPQPFMRQPLNPFAAFRVQPTRATESEREYYDLRSAYQQARATVTALDRQYEQAEAAGDEDAMRRLEARNAELQRNPLFAQANRDVAAGAGASDVLNWDKQVQDRMDDIQADIDYVESEYAAKRMTGERARKLIDEYNTERRSLMREATAGLRSKMGTPR